MANPAINIALIAAAQQQALNEKALLDQLRKAGATGPRQAAPLDLSVKGSDQLLEGLLKRNHVRSSGGGLYWLDEEAIANATARTRSAGLIVLVALISVTASLIALAAAF
jgi:hypothetical protein